MLKYLKILLTLFIAIILLLGFALPLNPVGNWYQQFMPNIGTKQINDIIFLDSLTGFAVASRNVNPDTASILRTTDGGDNWQVIFTQTPKRFNRIQFINSVTGFVCGGSGGGTPQLFKTIDSGQSWSLISSFGCALWKDMYVLDENTIWLVDDNSLCGGVFFTSNGGANWQQQPAPPANKIYMYNARIGFMSNNSASPNIYKTTNGGLNWNLNLPGENFTDMHFTDSLTGWKCTNSSNQAGQIKKTTNGGTNWTIQNLPPELPPLSFSRMYKFSFVNQDTIWGVGGVYSFPNGQDRAIIYKSTNGGLNWNYQIPDTSIKIYIYSSVQFVDTKKGWAYSPLQGGVHTIKGGDTITSVPQISNEVPKIFELSQNYPNPFNPNTMIRFQINRSADVKIIVFDITGKQIIELVNKLQTAGTYEVDFSGSNLSSGVYFYSLFSDDKLIDTKKMILLK